VAIEKLKINSKA